MQSNFQPTASKCCCPSTRNSPAKTTTICKRQLPLATANSSRNSAVSSRARSKPVRKRSAANTINPPHTLEFAILFIPTESLYAEVLRQPGLFEQLQRDHRVIIA